MANQITIIFEPCSPAPANGYVVQYRPVGSSDPYTEYPDHFFSSPIVFNDGGAEPDGTEYEGFLFSDCGGGNFGTPIHWTTEDCDPVVLPAINFPDAVVGVAYNYSFVVAGSAPFGISAVTKPGWMTISVVGNTISFTGTPTGGTVLNTPVQFTVSNCSGANTANVNETLNVYQANLFIENLTLGAIHHVVNNCNGAPGWGPGSGYTVISGAFPVLPSQTLVAVHTGYPGPLWGCLITSTEASGTPNKKVEVRKNGAVVFSQPLFPGGSLIPFSGVSFTAADEIRVQILIV